MIKAVTAVATIALTLTACTSTSSPKPTPPPVSPTAPVTTPQTVASSQPPATSPAPASTPASTSPSKPTPTKSSPKPTKSHPSTTSAPPKSSQPPSSTPPPPPPSGPQPCTADQLTATGIRGGAYQGREVAGVLFTNSSTSTCTVQGYPFAQLTYRGKRLGKPATHDPGAQRTIVLKPGRAAQSQLTAVTTCQSPISDHVIVRVPNTTKNKSVPMELRGCSLSIAPLESA